MIRFFFLEIAFESKLFSRKTRQQKMKKIKTFACTKNYCLNPRVSFKSTVTKNKTKNVIVNLDIAPNSDHLSNTSNVNL